MTKTYRHIIFDLDHTLWDFKKNAYETLGELYHYYRLADTQPFSVDQFCEAFDEVTHGLWQQYNEGRIDQQRMRAERFAMIFARVGADTNQVPPDMADRYLRTCPTKPHLMPHALATLDYLRPRYQLHILTNGFAKIQAIKMASAHITNYFTEVVSSDTMGHRKPHQPVFEYTLQRIGTQPGECLMVGDNLIADVGGARNACIDQVYYNPGEVTHQEEVTYEISCLRELQHIL